MLDAGVRIHNHLHAVGLQLLDKLPGQSAHGTGTAFAKVMNLAYGHQLDAILAYNQLRRNILQ